MLNFFAIQSSVFMYPWHEVDLTGSQNFSSKINEFSSHEFNIFFSFDYCRLTVEQTTQNYSITSTKLVEKTSRMALEGEQKIRWVDKWNEFVNRIKAQRMKAQWKARVGYKFTWPRVKITPNEKRQINVIRNYGLHVSQEFNNIPNKSNPFNWIDAFRNALLINSWHITFTLKAEWILRDTFMDC